MDVNRWKYVLYDWIKSSEIIDIFHSIEQVQLNDFFYSFYYKIFPDKSNKSEKIKIAEFIEEKFPDFEILYDEANNISSQDYVYIFSLLLYYSCVTKENEFFQKCCSNLNAKYQLGIADFLDYLIVNSNFSKESLRTAINCAVTAISPKKGDIFAIVNSPTKTPNKKDRLSTPPTPNKEFVHQKLKELKQMKSRLENERFEKSMLEVEVKQGQEKIENLISKCRALNNELKSLKSEFLQDKEEENCSPNKQYRESQWRKKMQKEIQSRDDLISDLKMEIDSLNDKNQKYEAKMSAMQLKISKLNEKIRDLEESLDEMQYCVHMKDEKIQMLEEEKRDLLEFINETRSTSKNCSSSSSSDLFEFSCSTYHTINNSDLGESLGKSMIDVQLKEKETEVQRLKEMLSLANIEKDKLEFCISGMRKNMTTLEVKLNDEKALRISNSRKIDEKECEINKLQEELSKLVSERDTHQEELNRQNQDTEKLREELNSMKNKLDQAQKDVEHLISAKNAAENVLEQERVASKTEIDELLEKISRFSNEKDSLKAKVDSILSKHQEFSRKFSEKEQENDQLVEKLKEIEELYTYEKVSSSALIDEQRTLSDNLVLKEKQYEEELLDLKLKFDKITREKFEDKRDFENNEKRLREELETLRAQSFNDISQQKEEIQLLKLKLEEKAEKIKDLEAEVEVEHDLLLESRAENEMMQKKMTLQEETIFKLRNDLNEIEKNHNAMLLELKSSYEKTEVSSSLRKEITDMKLHIEEIENQNASNKLQFEKELALKLEQCGKLKKQLEEVKQENEKYLEDLQREKLFNDAINQNFDVLKAKLEKSRQDLKTEQTLWEVERKELRQKIEEYKIEANYARAETKEKMTIKLEALKDSMKNMYREAAENFKLRTMEKDQEIEQLKGQIKSLNQSIDEYKREKDTLLFKLKFKENNSEMIQKSCGPNVFEEEKFDNAFLENLKVGLTFEDMLSAEVLQQRNSKVPNHLRDSYAISNLDCAMSEDEIKFGVTNKDMKTPSKSRARLSITSLKSVKSAFKDSTNRKALKITKSFMSSFKNKDESNKRRKKFRTPKDFNKKFIVDRVEEEEDDSPMTVKKEIELDRKRKRNMARDQNRLNLNENCDDTLVNTSPNTEEDDADWIEDDDDEDEKSAGHLNERLSSSSKHDSSLERVKQFENNQRRQKQMRRRNFNENRRRRSSPSACGVDTIRNEVRTSYSFRNSNDWEKYQSCWSLKTDSFRGSETVDFLTPKKSDNKMFFATHIDHVQRMSDYYAPPMRPHKIEDNVCESRCHWWDFFLNNVQRPLLLTVIALLTIKFLATIYDNLKNY